MKKQFLQLAILLVISIGYLSAQDFRIFKKKTNPADFSFKKKPINQKHLKKLKIKTCHFK
jgi:hypothetical protein